VDDNFFQVFSEVWIEDWSLARFFFVRFCQRDALLDATAYRLGGMKDRDGPLAIFDDDLRARTRSVSEVFAIGLKSRKPKLVEPMRFESTYNMITKELCGAPWPSMVSNKEEFLVPPCCPQKTRYHMFNSDTLPSRRFPDLP